MPDIETRILNSQPAGLARAAELLRAGGLVAFPTETVYGLGADARDDRAVARIFEAKGRPRFNPLIVHVPDLAHARRHALFNADAERLADAFWPGPMTLVLPLHPGSPLSELVTAELPSVAIRVPAHPVARALLTAFGGPVAAPSANPSGRVSPTSAAHVSEGLSGRIEAIVDGGDCPVGVESTIIGLTGAPVLLRPGGLPAEDIEACLGAALDAPGESLTPTAPGQLASHYAPKARVRLNVDRPDETDFWIGFGPGTRTAAMTLSASGDLVEAAANLFATLRNADKSVAPGQTIAFAPVPERGLGRAINDRLRRAAAPRP